MDLESLREQVDVWCLHEFSEVDFGDERLNQRFIRVANRLLNKPMSSINEACGSWKESKAAYRLFDNEKVRGDEILSAHQGRTLERMQECKRVLVVQDTCFLNYNSHFSTTGLGPIGIRGGASRQSQGLVLHSAFALDPTDGGRPLGVLDQLLWARTPRQAPAKNKTQEKKARANKRGRILSQTPFEEKESYKWVQLLLSTRELVPETIELIHVCDREADITEFIQNAEEHGARVLVRATHDRSLDFGAVVQERKVRLWGWMQSQPEQGQIKIEVPRESKTKDRNKRDSRKAVLSVRFSAIQIAPNYEKKKRGFRINAIYAREVDAPKGVEPIEWMLLTQVAVQSYDDAIQIIGWYKMRWHIENYHRVLKSGCQVESCQLESKARLDRYLALMSVLAWRIYWMSRASRTRPESSCDEFLAPHEWKALYCRMKNTRKAPAKPPSVYQAIRWIAQLGGFWPEKATVSLG